MNRNNFGRPSFNKIPTAEQLRINKINEELANANRASRIPNDGGRWRIGSPTMAPNNPILLGRRAVGSPILGRSSVVPILGRTPEVPILGRPAEIPILGRSFLAFVNVDDGRNPNGFAEVGSSVSDYTNMSERSYIGSTYQERYGFETTSDTISEAGSSIGSTSIASSSSIGYNPLERIPITPCNIAGRRILRPRRSAKTPYARISSSVELRKVMRPPGMPILGRRQQPKKNSKDEQFDPKA